MIRPLSRDIRRRLMQLAISVVAVVSLLLSPGLAQAEATVDPSPILQELQKELASLQSQQGIYTVQQARRLADLSRLETAIAGSDDRPTVENSTSHNLGVFVRSKRQRSDQPTTFVVLGASHETDDDFESLALYIPANVALSWPGRQSEPAPTFARVALLVPGQALQVSESESSSGYQLNLPVFALERESADLGALPAFSQEELDAQPETAPVD